MFINWEISIGNLIYLTVLGFGGLWALFKIQAKVDASSSGVKRLENRTGLMENAIRELEKATVLLTAQTERMNQQDARMNRIAQEIRDVRHGRGFILDLPGRASPSKDE